MTCWPATHLRHSRSNKLTPSIDDNSDLSTLDPDKAAAFEESLFRLSKELPLHQKMVEEAAKGAPFPHEFRYICNIRGCTKGSNINAEHSKHFKAKKGPHMRANYNIKNILKIEWSDWLRDDGLNASAAATTKDEFYAALSGANLRDLSADNNGVEDEEGDVIMED
jgi:hypothetical protein